MPYAFVLPAINVYLASNSDILKLSALFAKFLYEHKELKLPGLGIFTLDPSAVVPDPSDKNYHEFTKNIRFVQQPVAQADEAFINFIRTETGKIKPLAESDLDSFLSDGKILLNIGKPFYLEGIGSLTKTSAGKYEFTPGDAIISPASKPVHVIHEQMEEPKKNKPVFTEDLPAQNNARRLLITLGAIAGIVIVIWAGYYLYHRNTPKAKVLVPEEVSVTPSDTSSGNELLDSVQSKIDSLRSTLSATGTYKFVIERTNKARALRRYAQIRETLTDIRLETPDSTQFTLYFILPAQPSDTARIKDSLRIWYGRKQVWIE